MRAGMTILLGLLLAASAFAADNPKLNDGQSTQEHLRWMDPNAGAGFRVSLSSGVWDTVYFGFMASEVSIFAETSACSLQFIHDTTLYTLAEEDSLQYASGRGSAGTLWRFDNDVTLIPANGTHSGPWKVTALRLKGTATSTAVVYAWGSPRRGGP